MPQQRSWSLLPSDLLQKIANNLTNIADLFRLRSVCAPWRSAEISVDLPPQQPWLLFPSNPYAEPNEPRHFFSLSRNRVASLHLPSRARTTGSSDGWLITVEGAQSLSLLNPITQTRILLPPLTDPFHSNTDSEIRRAKLCDCKGMASSASSYVVMVSFWCSSTLACYQSGEETWKYILVDVDLGPGDFTFHNGHFFVLRNDGGFAAINPSSLKQEFVVPSKEVVSFHRRYLVQSSKGDLLLIVTPSPSGKKRFGVFRLGFTIEKQPKWFKTRNIGDDMLFVDDKHAICLSSTSFSGFKKNCIYFTHVYRVCLYNICGDRIEQLMHYWKNFPYPKELKKAVWFVPSLS